MMRYLPHTEEDVESMLNRIGLRRLDDLFDSIPQNLRKSDDLRLPTPMTEWELNTHMEKRSKETTAGHKVFVGAGSYEHYIPQSVSDLSSRSEFVTSYTPYQPEMSQGTLQAIFEYQTYAARLLGMDVANASLYDGASALAEALLMAVRVTRKNKVAICASVHPNYRRVVRTYFTPTAYEIVEIPYAENGRIDDSKLDEVKDAAAICVQSPNFFGCIEDVETLAKKAHAAEALLVVSFTEPLTYGMYKNPGSFGADIVCGEGQSFGIPRSYGGPGLGMFATKMKYIRSMPGRLVGQTVDSDGNRGFVLTLATREQHIRRERATSNICTNSSHCALTATIFMASLGNTGIKALARLNYDKTEYLKTGLKSAGMMIRFDAPTFNEFVVKFPPGFDQKHRRAADNGMIPGISLAPFYPELADCYLLCVTETKSKADMDRLIEEVTS